MKNTIAKITSLILALILTMSMFTACSTPKETENTTPTPAEATPTEAVVNTSITIVDSNAQTITLEKSPERIVALLPSDVEILYLLGASDKIVAVGEYCLDPAEVSEKPKLGTYSNFNMEEIVAMDPDLVITGTISQTDAQYEQLKALGIPVVISNAINIAQTYEVISFLGAIVEKNDEAQAIIDETKQGFEDLKQLSINQESKTIYMEISPPELGIFTAGKGTFMQELFDIVKVTNVFADTEGFPSVSEEQIIERNPDYILTTCTDYYESQDAAIAEIKSRKTWQTISAIKNDKVFIADTDYFSRPTPSLLKGAQILYDIIYGSAN